VSHVDVATEPGRARIVLDAPHGNAITDTMVGAMREALARIAGESNDGAPTKLLTIESAGPDFSFGASLDEHVPARIGEVLPRFHGLVAELLRLPVATAAVVNGRCLGGGFELALACDMIFASDDAVLGLPEIRVGAFPPVGAILLPIKAGASRAAAAVLSGTASPAATWARAGLIEQIVPRAELAGCVDGWYHGKLERHSAAALRRAVLASRMVVLRTFDALLPHAERMYLDDLLTTADAAEGVAAFLDKRPPKWSNR
jgi:cyclohexa-1,5-dienecarbonyl-CoA hydratase